MKEKKKRTEKNRKEQKRTEKNRKEQKRTEKNRKEGEKKRTREKNNSREKNTTVKRTEPEGEMSAGENNSVFYFHCRYKVVIFAFCAFICCLNNVKLLSLIVSITRGYILCCGRALQ
jgi:hypothetical protein